MEARKVRCTELTFSEDEYNKMEALLEIYEKSNPGVECCIYETIIGIMNILTDEELTEFVDNITVAASLSTDDRHKKFAAELRRLTKKNSIKSNLEKFYNEVQPALVALKC